MKLRSALLVACMLVVPLLAMFSHKCPAGTRAAARRQLWDPIVDTVAAAFGLPSADRKPRLPPSPPTSILPESSAASAPSLDSTPGPGSTRRRDSIPDIVPRFPGAVSGSPESPPDPLSTVGLPPARGAWSSPPAPSSPPSPGVASAAPAFAAPPRALPGAPDAHPIAGAAGFGTGADRDSLESRLRSLGATSIDWTPAQGGDGLHRCTCRIPAEPTGQLHRVFQASATDPLTALDSLVGQVTAWSMRAGQANDSSAAGPRTAPVLR